MQFILEFSSAPSCHIQNGYRLFCLCTCVLAPSRDGDRHGETLAAREGCRPSRRRRAQISVCLLSGPASPSRFLLTHPPTPTMDSARVYLGGEQRATVCADLLTPFYKACRTKSQQTTSTRYLHEVRRPCPAHEPALCSTSRYTDVSVRSNYDQVDLDHGPAACAAYLRVQGFGFVQFESEKVCTLPSLRGVTCSRLHRTFTGCSGGFNALGEDEYSLTLTQDVVHTYSTRQFLGEGETYVHPRALQHTTRSIDVSVQIARPERHTREESAPIATPIKLRRLPHTSCPAMLNHLKRGASLRRE